MLGLGYAVPYLRPFMDDADRVIAAMPPAQGVLPWPSGGPNRVLLADEAELPLPDLSMDRVLLIHAVEQTEQLRQMLRERDRDQCRYCGVRISWADRKTARGGTYDLGDAPF